MPCGVCGETIHPGDPWIVGHIAQLEAQHHTGPTT